MFHPRDGSRWTKKRTVCRIPASFCSVPPASSRVLRVSSVFIYSQIESGDVSGAAAVSVVLLLISFVVLLAMGRFSQRILRHDDA